MKSIILFKKKGLLLLPLLLLFVQQTVLGQSSLTGIGVPVTENFNTLVTSGSTTWTNATTLPVWYAYTNAATPANYSANSGSTGTASSLYSFGTGTSTDRALGVTPVSSAGATGLVGWRFKNNTGQTITSVKVTWTSEQWSYGGGASQIVKIGYKTTNTANLALSGLTGQQNYSTPVSSGATGARDGNTYKSTQTTTFSSLSIPAGNEITIVWSTTYNASQALIAIDDISVVAQAAQNINTYGTPSPTPVYGDAQINLDDYFAASSGLALRYSSANTSIATISGNLMTIVGPGNVDITAYQDGNDSYSAAVSTFQTFSINPKAPVMDVASAISTTGFTSTWACDNGLNNANTAYQIFYTQDNTFTSGVSLIETALATKTATITGLTPDRLYYYRTWAMTDGNQGDYSQAYMVTTGHDYTSSSDGTWDALNWVEGGSPNPYGNKVTIRHLITAPLTSPATRYVNTLVIEANGKLDNYDDIYVTGTLIIESDATGKTGQIKNMNAIHFGAGAKIIYRKTFSAAYGWYFMGFPYSVSGTNIYLGNTSTQATWGDAGTYHSGDAEKDFYVYAYDGQQRDQTSGFNSTAGLNWVDESSHSFVAKKGYNVLVLSDKIVDYVIPATSRGNIFDLSATTTVAKYTTNPCQCHNNWNLVVTPFASSFDLHNSNEAPYYVFNHTTKGYDVYMSNENVSVYPYTAFFVQANTTSMSFAQAGRGFKVRSVDTEASTFDELNLTLSNNSYSDYTRVRFQDGASAAYEIGTDAAKFVSPVAAIPQIYTSINGFGAAVNTLPTTLNTFDLTTKIGTVGNYTITLANPEKLSNYSAITLVDNVTGASTDLLSGSYTYNSSTTGTSTRFKVTLTPDVVNSVAAANNLNLVVSVADNKVYVRGLITLADINVYDATGKLYKSVKKVSNGQSVDLANKGIYILEINSGEGKSRVKIINN
jgi:hypothetical protein